MSKEPIFPESTEAATFMKVEGWVSRDGRFYGKDERTARWGGATHIYCRECGEPCPKNWLVCEACREKKDKEKDEEGRSKFMRVEVVGEIPGGGRGCRCPVMAPAGLCAPNALSHSSIRWSGHARR